MNYLELPLNVVYKFEGGSGNFFAGAGPSLRLWLYRVKNSRIQVLQVIKHRKVP